MMEYCVKVAILAFVMHSINAFNLSPKPNLVLQEPKLKTFMTKVQSSYFGFAINIRKSSIIVGAPRAQSTLETQSAINETGAIYKCSLNGICTPYNFDPIGNYYEKYIHLKTYENALKNNQWLGGSIDGGSKDTDALVVCAPRLLTESQSIQQYLIHGACYWTPNTLFDQPQNVKKIASLRKRKNQILYHNGKQYFYHAFGEQGISSHITDNSEEILIGAPGIYIWRGSVVRHFVKSNTASQVARPELWSQEAASYFGYSVSSGIFDSAKPTKILYLATAPHALKQSGEAYIYDFFNVDNDINIRKYYTFYGSQFGEYYGYACLAEDLNGDGLTDVIITAPQFSSKDNTDQGAIYVYLNQGRLVFKLQKKIVSPINGNGRFGSSISKLGDINHDGYNDIAVGAPFADNGVVFIYLGSPTGLRVIHSQKFSAIAGVASWGLHMFGHGLSKGSDIDDNEFNDFAIGAPNAEAVYVYRAYPVVKIEAAFRLQSREIKPDQSEMNIKICYKISTTSTKVKNQDLTIRLSADAQVKRVTFKESKSNTFSFNVTAWTKEECRTLDVTVRLRTEDIFKPIDLEMHYDLVNGVPNSDEFCERCAIVDPADPKVQFEKIIFNTGCKGHICIADLEVNAVKLEPSYVLGSSKAFAVTYDVSNSGETAYLPQINISSSNQMPFTRIPVSCHLHKYVLLCDLNQGNSLAVGGRANITISYDVSQLEGTTMILTATGFSTGDELKPSNNIAMDTVALQEFTNIKVFGKPHAAQIFLTNELDSTEIIYNYEIRNNGPSRIQELEIAIEIPVGYKSVDSTDRPVIVDINNITVEGVYDHQLLAVELFQNNTRLREIFAASTETTEAMQNETESSDGEISSDNFQLDEFQRPRREIKQMESNNESLKVVQNNSSDNPMGNLPMNRTILFSCNDSDTTICVRAVLRVYNFVPENPINITLKYHIDLKEVNKILIEPMQFFKTTTRLNVTKIGDIEGKTTTISQHIESIVIVKQQLRHTPIWVIILGILGGLALLTGMIYGMRKVGFFRRKTKEEMQRLIQAQKQAADQPAEIPEDRD